MTLKIRHHGNAAEYGIILALVVGLSIYGLKTLGPAFSGNFKKVDSMGTLSLLAPLGASGTGAHSPGNPQDQQISAQDNGAGASGDKGTENPIVSGPRGINNVLDNPDQISETPDYNNLVSGSLGQEETIKPSTPPVTDQNPTTNTPISPPPSNTSPPPASAEVTNDFTTGLIENVRRPSQIQTKEINGNVGDGDTRVSL